MVFPKEFLKKAEFEIKNSKQQKSMKISQHATEILTDRCSLSSKKSSLNLLKFFTKVTESRRF